MKLVYPAVFYPEDTGGYSVIIPDLNDLATQGESLADAIYMAEDACGLYIYTTIKDGEEVPKASDIGKITLDEEGAFINFICIDMTEFASNSSAVSYY
ncbi:MAG: type II toxin-antitoxin system HicB family antitoxin [Clostridiales bacterium]|nr:type II toxin-antitoxin system HicB family antitoxin [Clostridiales bacterium]